MNAECGKVNLVPYGKTYREKKNNAGMPCFVINKKLGTGMIDSIDGSDRLNNLLSTLNLKPLNPKTLKTLEIRACSHVGVFAEKSTRRAAKESFHMEMEEIAEAESNEVLESMGEVIEDLGVCPLPDAPPETRQLLAVHSSSACSVFDFSDEETMGGDGTPMLATSPERKLSKINNPPVLGTPLHTPSKEASPERLKTPCNAPHLVQSVLQTPSALRCKKENRNKVVKSRRGLRPLTKYPCKTRQWMSAAVDTAWHKRGFDSLTSHTFFMSKAKYGKKVIKSLVRHRKCGTCSWWRRNRPNMPVRDHRCIKNHVGSAKLMECKSGVQGIRELAEEGTPVEIVEGDGVYVGSCQIGLECNYEKAV